MVVPHLGDSVENVSSVLQINSKSQTPNVHEERALCLFKWEEVIFRYLTEDLKSMLRARKLQMHSSVLHSGKLAIFKTHK